MRPVLAFFSNKDGVGRTSTVYHLAWMLAELGHRVVVCDLDPQASLTTSFLRESELEELWNEGEPSEGSTIYSCVQPLAEGGDLLPPRLKIIDPRLALLPGDISLASFEDDLSSEWLNSVGNAPTYHSLRVPTAFWQVMQLAAKDFEADLVLVDTGPGLGAINRSALIGSDYVVVPMGTDLFSLQSLRNLGPVLMKWKQDWKTRVQHWPNPSFELPSGAMRPLGYVVQQASVRLSRPVRALDQWVSRVPAEFRHSVLQDPDPIPEMRPADDPFCLAVLKHYRSLMALALEARKPVFDLTIADGAIGSHFMAVRSAQDDFKALANAILNKMPEANRSV